MKDNQCQWCGRFCKYEEMDSYTPYGCASYDPPEPHDPTYICKKCSQSLKEDWIEKFKNGRLSYGDWQKSQAEIEAAKECDLVWVGNTSKIKWKGRELFCEYVPRKIYNKLIKSQLPNPE